jgi:signal transduction histidine kinase
VWGDSFLLRRAFACAIENALEAMGSRGTLWLATTRSRRGGHERVTVEIGDTGPGMSEVFLRERLSRPFASTKEDGLGLGMYTFRQVAHLHGGSARILTTEGVGTRVRFHFPAPDA